MTPEHRQKRQSRELKQTRKGFSIKKRLVTAMCNVPFIRDRGLKNALDIQIREFDWQFSKLPDQANDLRILHLSDTHLDGVPGLLEVLKDKIAKLDFDIAVLTGDYRFDKGAFEQKTIDPTLDLINFLQTLGPVYAVPGNHDCLDTIEQIEKTGAHILINQHVDYKGITIAGVDDPHYFETHDLEQALHDVPKENFKLLLAHSPEIIPQAHHREVDFYLCGHTHGGQVRLPLFGMVHWNARCKKMYADGHFVYESLQGFTHRGTGSSNSPIRFNCPPEIVIHVLRKA